MNQEIRDNTYSATPTRRTALRCAALTAAVLTIVAGLSFPPTPAVAMPDDPPPAEVVVDNSGPGFTKTGTWTAAQGLPDFYGADYVYAAPGSGTATARWTPDVPRSGTYGVYYWLPDGNPARATDAPFTVHDSRGSFTYRVNQRSTDGGRWVLLGNHRFTRGSKGYVQLSTTTSGAVNADAVKLGAPGQEPIETQVARAVAAGKKDVRIKAGVYRRNSPLNLSGLNGVTLRAKGVTIVQTQLVQALTTGKSNGLTIEGLTINYDPLPFTQGRVIGIAPDKTSWMDVQISQGYSRPATLPNRVTIFDPGPRLPTSQTLGASVSWKDKAAGIARSSNAWSADVGDIVTFAGGAVAGASFGITVGGADTTFRDVRLHAAPGMGLMNASGEGNTHLDGFHIVPGPPPPGATESPILTSTWDAIQFQSVKKGPVVENSSVVNAGDDSLSIQGIGGFDVLKTQDDTIWVGFSDLYRLAQPGDRIQQWAEGPTATIRSLEPEKDPGIKALGPKPNLVYRLTLDKPSPWRVGTELTDIDRMGNGFVVRNNRFDSSGRGLLLKARDGVIKNNWMRGSNAVSVSTEMWSDSHTNAGGNVTIKGNTFLSALWSGGGLWDSCQVGAVSFEGGSATRHLYPQIAIVDNVFKDIRGLNLSLAQISGGTVRNNRFEGSQQIGYSATSNRCHIPKTSVVHVRDSEQITFEGNTIDRVGPYSVQTVSTDPKTTTGINGLPSGVTVRHSHPALDSAHVHTLTNRAGARALTAVGQGSDAPAAVSLEPGQPGAGQGWRFVPVGPDTVRIQNELSGLFLTAGPGATVSLQRQADDTAQIWQLLDTANHTVKIKNTASGGMLGSAAATGGTAPRLTITPAAGTLAQSWQTADVSLRWTADRPQDSATTGKPYEYGFTAAGDPAARYTVRSGSLPGGLTLDATTGVLRGTPTTAGTFTFTVTADNGYTATAGGTHTLHVTQSQTRQPQTPSLARSAIWKGKVWSPLATTLRELIERQAEMLRRR